MVVAGGPAYRQFLTRLEATRTLGVSLGLARMAEALARLGWPERRVPAVHIAGTNGKGSTAAMVDSILRAAGCRTGLFTSPHLARFTERIRIDGQEIDGEWLAELGARVFATGVPLTYFEVGAALGFLAAAEAAVDVAVLEVGLGGRLDATNLCRPVATAITSIALDHTELLGDSLGAIAHEKAGIAKPGVPMFLAPVPEEARAEISRMAADVGAPLVPIAEAAGTGPNLLGEHQRVNAALARALAQQVARAQGFSLSEATIAQGLAEVTWPGRLELVAHDVLLDAAHNAEGARVLRAALPQGRQPRALVLSVVRGKAAGEMLATLAPAFDAVVLTRSSSARALPPEELAALVPPGPAVHVVAAPGEALALARRLVGEGASATAGVGASEGKSPAGGETSGLVVVAGSLFLVGELRAALRGEPVDPIVTGDPMP
jgi:dihydrofolate synthase/folylpolyglutamate synthase